MIFGGESNALNLDLCCALAGGQPHTGWSSEISTYRSDQSNSGPGARNYVHTTAWRHGDDGLMFALSQVQQVRDNHLGLLGLGFGYVHTTTWWHGVDGLIFALSQVQRDESTLIGA